MSASAHLDQSPSILLVDDDSQMRELLSGCLTAAGYHVLVAASAEQAVQVLQTAPSRILLLLTDLIMPGQYGDQLALHLQSLDPELKVVVMSGSAIEHFEHAFPLVRGINFLNKPFSFAELKQTVAGQLGNSLSAAGAAAREL